MRVKNVIVGNSGGSVRIEVRRFNVTLGGSSELREIVSVSAQVNPGKTNQGKRVCPHCGRFRFWSQDEGRVRAEKIVEETV